MASPLLNQLLDSLLPVPVSSTSSTFTLLPLPISSRDTPTTTTSYLTSTAVQTSPRPIQSSSSTLTSSSSSTTTLPLLPQDAVATSSYLQQYAAVRQLTNDLQQKKPRHPKCPQLPPGEEGTPVIRIVHTAIYKQSFNQCHNTLKPHENYIDEVLNQTTAELDKIITNVDSVVRK